MKIKYLKGSIKIMTALLCLCFVFILIEWNRSTVTKEVVNQIDHFSIYSWEENQVEEYKSQILAELSQMTRRSDLQKGFYALGLLEALDGNFEESTHYYLKALSIGEDSSSTICINLYKELAYNALALNDEESANYYFELAEKNVSKFYMIKLKSSLYRRFSQGIVEFSSNPQSSIPLLEFVIDKNVNEYDYLEAHRLLTNVYLLSGYYEKSIMYLLDAYKVSVWNDYKIIQEEVSIKLGQAYFLNGDYEQAISILESLFPRNKKDDFISYIPQLVESYRVVQGYDKAIEFLNDYVSQLSVESSEWLDFWYTWIRASLAINEGKVAEANDLIQHLDKVYTSNEELQETTLYLWKEKVELDYLVQTGIRNQEIADRYDQLYKEIVDSEIYVTAKINLLEQVVKQSIEINNYELGYQYLNERLCNFKSTDIKNDSFNIIEFYEMTLDQIKQNQIMMKLIVSIIGTLLVGGVGVLICIIFKKQSRIKALSNEIKAKQDVDTLTNTLTKEALYDCLEVHMGQDDLLNFMVINIDDFKRYNEVYGYLTGDRVLQKLAQLIKTTFPEAYVARHAGHHFIVVSPNDRSACLLKLEYLLEKMYDENIENTSNLVDGRVTISAGLSTGKVLTKLQVDQHINDATHKLGLSKKRGSNKVTV
ncbi:tetratricopeptide repeat-containing diguanylate cyclase [Turicibacter sanguinis]|uniref:tetratricopeptide repeat-containing diguanylate cyclase n=1 Tax=Turicibacter sanguinis TaxID=154288 RepID=UPI0012BD0B10|nr:diguanylate cyclase [Turicibacter sanguinis]MDB8436280.1 diguanylate cyclase [Turicibacter sanguinis]MDB8542880.1 diguanylate cyclase [Turicibacter sanguinis]MTO24875.1 diguanylate cyclase [Turicibacter sanguinis]MTO27874.1 diguanylate cyclase [Turicibacter sanguinis]MTO90535.1 diguanylate cyclase [Turicibacter sanguinis]